VSNEMINRAFNLSKAKGISRFVLVCLADYANADGTCFPGKGKIAKRCGIDKRTADRAIEDLLAIKEIEVVRHGGRAGEQKTSNLYRITISHDGCQDATRGNTPPVAAVQGTGGNTPGVPVAQCHPNHHINPQKNHHKGKPLLTRDGKSLDEALARLPQNLQDDLRAEKNGGPEWMQ
jgi:hypothetical protein